MSKKRERKICPKIRDRPYGYNFFVETQETLSVVRCSSLQFTAVEHVLHTYIETQETLSETQET